VLASGKTFREQFGPRGVLHCKADGMVEHGIMVGDWLQKIFRRAKSQASGAFQRWRNKSRA